MIDGKPSALTIVVPPKPQLISPQHGLAAASGATSPLQSLRLEAPWRLLTDSENSGRQAGWFSHIPGGAKPAPVPGTIQQVFPGYHGAAWYWTELEKPIDCREERGVPAAIRRGRPLCRGVAQWSAVGGA